jgi:integrase/recombinase XerD
MPGDSSIYQSDYLQDWIAMFLHDCRARNLSPTTVVFYTKKLRPFFQFCQNQGITRADQITAKALRDFFLFLVEKQHNPGGVHCYFRSVKRFLRWYGEELDQPAWLNPITKIQAPVVPITLLDAISMDTIKAMLGAGARFDWLDARDKAALLFLLDSGVRLSEFLAMNRNDVDMITGEIEVRSGKGRKFRTTCLGTKARKYLRRYLRQRRDTNSALWVSVSGERWTETGVRMMLRRRATRVGVPVPSPHGFRRAFAIQRWRAGADILTLSRLLGHSSLQVLGRYVKHSGADLTQAARETSPVDLHF